MQTIKIQQQYHFWQKNLTCISFTTSGLEKPNISEPVLSIFSPPPSAPEPSELLVCIFFILLYILFQQSDGVDPSNCKGKREREKLTYIHLWKKHKQIYLYKSNYTVMQGHIYLCNDIEKTKKKQSLCFGLIQGKKGNGGKFPLK